MVVRQVEQTGLVLILPYIAPVLGGNLGAQIADWLLAKGQTCSSTCLSFGHYCSTI